MRRFELWLDESGSFNEDNLIINDGVMVSHVGGILYDNMLPLDPVIKCSPGENFHATEANDANKLFSLFKKIAEQNIKIVLFQNTERLLIVDDKITYLNVITDGILQLIQKLKAMYGEIFLQVMIAVRRDNPKVKNLEKQFGPGNYAPLIEENEYIKRLEEKIILQGRHFDIHENEWKIIQGSARHDDKLVLSDIICNVFFTKDTKIRKRCGIEAANYVNRLYEDDNKTYRFSVVANPVTTEFYRYLYESRIGEAVSILCQDNDKHRIFKGMHLVRQRLEGMGTGTVEMHYNTLANLIKYYLIVSHDYNRCQLFLQNLLDHFLPALADVDEDKYKNLTIKMKFDILFYLDTLYDHIGDVISSLKCEKQCDEILRELPKNYDFIIYSVRYQLRKVNTRINLFQLNEAYEDCSKIVKQYKEIKSAIELAEDLFGGGDYAISLDELGKAYNSRLQIAAMLVRHNPNCYESALEDSRNALSEFESEADLHRVYGNMLHLETDVGHLVESQKAFTKLFNHQTAGVTFNDVVKDIGKRFDSLNVFDQAAYVRFMTESALRKHDFADQMFSEIQGVAFWSKNNTNRIGHPYEIIMWKYATMLMLRESYKAALNYYEEAINICFSGIMVTLMCIGIGIELERYSFGLKNKDKKCGNWFSTILKHIHRLKQDKLPKSITEMFGVIPNRETAEHTPEYFWKLSRQITY